MASLRSEVFLFSLRSVQKQIFQIATLYKTMSNPTEKIVIGGSISKSFL